MIGTTLQEVSPEHTKPRPVVSWPGLRHARTPRELTLPGVVTNLTKRLMMSTLPHSDRRADACCFPACDEPSTDRLTLPLCNSHCLMVHKSVSSLLEPDAVRDFLSTQPRSTAPQSRACGYIYIVRLGDRVKIGHSHNPANRFKQIPLEEVLAITPGSSSEEKAVHRKFAHLRTTGEWFRAEPELLEYARALPREGAGESTASLQQRVGHHHLRGLDQGGS